MEAAETPLEARFPHLTGWWVEVRPETPVTRKRLFRAPKVTERWRWTLKRPDPLMPFGFSIPGSGEAVSEQEAVAGALDKAAWWEDWKVREEQTRRINL